MLQIMDDMVRNLGQELFVTVASDSVEELMSYQAKKLVWENRGKWDFENSGIEAYGGVLPAHLAKEANDALDGVEMDNSRMDDDAGEESQNDLPSALPPETSIQQYFQVFKLTRTL